MMAFGINVDNAGVADLIRYHYYQGSGILFVAAIGNHGLPNAAFPAEMDEVIAVVALTSNGARNGNSNYGPAAELGGYTATGTVGVPTRFPAAGQITTVSQTSAASATISGIAALIWSRYPQWRNTDVRHRLRMAASHPYYRSWEDGYGPVDAYRAVGGFSRLAITGPTCTTRYQTNIALSAEADGDGPYSVLWSTGETTSTIYVSPPAPDTEEEYSVTVTDVFENKTMNAGHRIYTLPADDTRLQCES